MMQVRAGFSDVDATAAVPDWLQYRRFRRLLS